VTYFQDEDQQPNAWSGRCVPPPKNCTWVFICLL